MRVGPLKDTSGKIISDNKDAANLLNEYFSSVFTVENVSNVPKPVQIFKGQLDSEGLTRIVVQEHVVEKKLSELNVNKSPGPNGLHPKLLYELRKELSKPLSKLFQLSIDSGAVPQEWK